MARIELKQMFPFTSWDAATKRGETRDDFYYTLYIETAKSKAGIKPFIVVETYGEGTYETAHYNIDEALRDLNDKVRRDAKLTGWTPESE